MTGSFLQPQAEDELTEQDIETAGWDKSNVQSWQKSQHLKGLLASHFTNLSFSMWEVAKFHR